MSGTRSAPRPAAKPAAAKPGAARPAAAKPAAPKRAGKRAPAATPPLSGRRRWFWVGVLVAAVTIGLPLAHALFGEVVALLGGTLLLGVLLGRWTAPRR